MRLTLPLAAVALSFSSAARAAQWHTLGPRAMGMGGAQVAIAQGPLALYWNPAGLAQVHNAKGFVVGGGVRGEFTGNVLAGANDLNELASDCRAANADCTQARVNTALTRFGETGNGALADLGVAAAFNVGRVVVFVNDVAYIGGTPEVDLANTGACSGAGCVTNNRSKFTLRGGNFFEIGAGYGHELGQSGVMLGGNLKGIVGNVGYQELNIASDDAGSGSFSKFNDTSKKSFQPGVDLGLLWDIRETFPNAWWRPRFGVVARNINNPKFKQPDAAITGGDKDKFSLHGQSRAGFAISPMSWWTIASDVDITNNLTNVGGFKSRYLGVGTEVNVVNSDKFNLPLRFGIQKNIADTDSGVSWTAGLGLHFFHVTLDTGVMVSSRRTEVQTEGKSEKVPNNIAGGFQFGIQFGGIDEGARNKGS